jgi:hypothetical protein
MTDKPSGGASGDAEFQRWFAEQDPFGNTKAEPQKKQADNAPPRVRASWSSRFGIALLPALLLILGAMALAFAAGSLLRSLHGAGG